MTHRDRVYLAEPEYPKEDAYQAWVESEAYADWMTENTERLIAGKPIYETETFGISDKFYLLEYAKLCNDKQWSELSDDDKTLVDAWSEFCDSVAMAEMMKNAGGHEWKSQQIISGIKWADVQNAMGAVADRKVALMSEDYFNKYVWRGVI